MDTCKIYVLDDVTNIRNAIKIRLTFWFWFFITWNEFNVSRITCHVFSEWTFSVLTHHYICHRIVCNLNHHKGNPLHILYKYHTEYSIRFICILWASKTFWVLKNIFIAWKIYLERVLFFAVRLIFIKCLLSRTSWHKQISSCDRMCVCVFFFLFFSAAPKY